MLEPYGVLRYGNRDFELQGPEGRVARIYGGSLERAYTLAAAPVLLDACRALYGELLLYRDSFYEAVSTPDGDIPDEDDRESLKAVDAALDKGRAAIGRWGRASEEAAS